MLPETPDFLIGGPGSQNNHHDCGQEELFSLDRKALYPPHAK